MMLQPLFSSSQNNVYCIYELKTHLKAFIITPTLKDDNILCGQIFGLILDLGISMFLVFWFNSFHNHVESKNK